MHPAKPSSTVVSPRHRVLHALAASGRAAVAALLLAAPRVTLATAGFSGDPLHPLGTVTVENIVGRIIGAALGLVGSISLLMFVWGGIGWMLAQGNEEKIKKAKNTIIYSALGLIVTFGAYAFLRFFFNDILRPSTFTPSS